MAEVSIGVTALVALGALVFLVVFFALIIRYVVHGQQQEKEKKDGE